MVYESQKVYFTTYTDGTEGLTYTLSLDNDYDILVFDQQNNLISKLPIKIEATILANGDVLNEKEYGSFSLSIEGGVWEEGEHYSFDKGKGVLQINKAPVGFKEASFKFSWTRKEDKKPILSKTFSLKKNISNTDLSLLVEKTVVNSSQKSGRIGVWIVCKDINGIIELDPGQVERVYIEAKVNGKEYYVLEDDGRGFIDYEQGHTDPIVVTLRENGDNFLWDMEAIEFVQDGEKGDEALIYNGSIEENDNTTIDLLLNNFNRVPQTGETFYVMCNGRYFVKFQVKAVGEYVTCKTVEVNDLTGPQGKPGEDGSNIRYVYYRCTETNAPESDALKEYNGGSTNLPDGWHDSPLGITPELPYEYVSISTKPAGTNTSWSSFSQPVIWSKWGEKGQDGDGVEYEFYQSDSANRPTYNADDAQWTDEPRGVTKDKPYEYVIKIKIIHDSSGKEKREPVGEASLWAKWGENGRGVASVVNYYLASTYSTGVTCDNGPWGMWSTNIPTNFNKENRYLWNYEITKDDAGDTISTTDPTIIGTWGEDGRGISSIEEYYAKTTTESKPSDNNWVKVPGGKMPVIDNTYKYLWNYEKIIYTNGDSTTTEPAIIGAYGDKGNTEGTMYIYALTATPEPPELPTQDTIGIEPWGSSPLDAYEGFPYSWVSQGTYEVINGVREYKHDWSTQELHSAWMADNISGEKAATFYKLFGFDKDGTGEAIKYDTKTGKAYINAEFIKTGALIVKKYGKDDNDDSDDVTLFSADIENENVIIGGWTARPYLEGGKYLGSYLGSADNSAFGRPTIMLSTKEIPAPLFITDDKWTPLMLKVGINFGVDGEGTLYANNAIIRGDITATSLKLGEGAEIDDKLLTKEDLETELGNLGINLEGYIKYTDIKQTEKTDEDGNTYLSTTITNADGTEVSYATYNYNDYIVFGRERQGTGEDKENYFAISKTGLLRARNAVIYGEIHASTGYIGGWEIGSDVLFSNDQEVILSPDGVTVVDDNGTTSDVVFKAGSNFKVTKDGTLHVNGAQITGDIVATRLQLGSDEALEDLGIELPDNIIVTDKAIEDKYTYVTKEGDYNPPDFGTYTVVVKLENGQELTNIELIDVYVEYANDEGTSSIRGSTVTNIDSVNNTFVINIPAGTTYDPYADNIRVQYLYTCKQKKDGESSTSFLVSSDGLLTAKNAIISGMIYASIGDIGGWNISENGLTCDNLGLISNNELAIYSGGNIQYYESVENVNFDSGSTYTLTIPNCSYICSVSASVSSYDLPYGAGVVSILTAFPAQSNQIRYTTQGNGVTGKIKISCFYSNANQVPFFVTKKGELYADQVHVTKGYIRFENPDDKWVEVTSTGGVRILSPDFDRIGKIPCAQYSAHLIRYGIATDYESAKKGTEGAITNYNSIYFSFTAEKPFARLEGDWVNKNDTSILSDANLKNHIEYLDDRYDQLFDSLLSRRFMYNDGTSSRYHTGYIAQEVQSALKAAQIDEKEFAALCTFAGGTEEEFMALRYDEFVSLNTWQIQKLKPRVLSLEQTILNYESRILALENEIQNLKKS